MYKRIGGAALALAAAALLTAACGSSSDGGSPSSAASAADYQTCLRNNGVDLGQAFGGASGRPTVRPSGQPTSRPSGGFSGGPRPSGSGGFRGGGGGFFGTAAPNGVDQQTWEKAQKACESLRPTAFPDGGPGGSRGPGGGGGNGREAAYRNCLTEHGVTLTGGTDQLNTTDPKVAAAVTACAPLKPAPAAS